MVSTLSMPGAPFPNPHNRKCLQLLASVSGGAKSLCMRTSVLPSVKYLHIKYVSCLGVRGLLEAIDVRPPNLGFGSFHIPTMCP